MNNVRNTHKVVEAPKPAKRRLRKFNLINRKKIGMMNKNISIGKSVASVLDGSFLTRENLLRQIPFMIFITILGVIYIANSYNAEKTIIEISKTKKELEELRFEYITTKSSLMFLSKQSEVAYRLVNSEVKESTVPPIKLINSTASDE